MGWPRHGMWAVIHVSQWVRLFSFHPRLSDHSLYNGLGARSNIVFLWHCKAQTTSHCFLHFTKVGIWLWSGSNSGVHPYLERHLAHPRPSLHMHMHGWSKANAVIPNPARMREHPVLWHGCKTEQGESGMKPRPLAAPAECFLTVPCSSAPQPPYATCFPEKLSPKDIPKTHSIILLELLQRPKLSWVHQCRSLR